MESTYLSQVQAYGQRWHRPWLGFLLCLALLWALYWLTHGNSEETDGVQVLCEQVEGSRYRAAVNRDGLSWTADLEAALACGLKHERRVFLAFHGLTDCDSERNAAMFSNHRVKAALKRHVLVMLYTDVVPDRFYRQEPNFLDQRKDAEANLKFREATFTGYWSRVYVVLEPREVGEFEILGEYGETVITDPVHFVRFLHDPRPQLLDGFWGNAIHQLRKLAIVP
jgi:hypothetical protein